MTQRRDDFGKNNIHEKENEGSIKMPKASENAEKFIPLEALAIGPLDGRYAQISKELSPYFSEFALVSNRVKVEVLWLICLMECVPEESEILEELATEENLEKLQDISESFDYDDYAMVKEIEKRTNHDVKAVELFVAEKLKKIGLDKLVSFVHIGCTSEDITNCAYGLMISQALEEVWYPKAEKLISDIADLALKNADVAMLAHTHGQPATPTTVGKEFAVYVHRFRHSLEYVKCIKILAKFSGATGNWSAMSVAFPNINWQLVSKDFIEDYLGLEFNPATTQIESHDYVCHILDGIRNFNNILRDFDLDMWLYISMEYFKQLSVKTEVGSSTMPHKVNPIRFENSEANIKIGNVFCAALSDELPRSRLQRDLSDSSLQRNIGLAFGYSLQAIEQSIGGLKKVAVNKEKIAADLEDNWEVLAEPIQTMLRKYVVPDAYDQLKELTRGKEISKEDIHECINSLEVLSAEDKQTLLELTPSTYIGYAEDVANGVCGVYKINEMVGVLFGELFELFNREED